MCNDKLHSFFIFLVKVYVFIISQMIVFFINFEHWLFQPLKMIIKPPIYFSHFHIRIL